MSSELPLPPRIIHLLGGLRAVDERIDHVWLQVSRDKRFGHFPTPPYASLYRDLRTLGLTPIGVEFVDQNTFRGLRSPDWECASDTGFKIREERNTWNEVRHAALDNRDVAVANVASRTNSYLNLLPIRIFQLSHAYNQTLRAWHLSSSDRTPGHLFSNTFMPHIDAAIHGFLADAASFRDLIAETVWTQVLGEPAGVTTLNSFLKKAAKSPHPLAATIVAAGKPGGWLYNFTDLRNQVTHVAPVGRSQTFHFCEPRQTAYSQKLNLVALHYPLLDKDGKVRTADDEPPDFNDEAAVRARLEDYRIYCASSIDGLDYAWRTLGQLVDLQRDARLAANLQTKRLVITEDDVIGEIRRIL